jgi:hypothetical protein
MSLPVYGGVMGQTKVISLFNSAVAGQINYDSGAHRTINSFAALETIYAGLAVYTAPAFVPSPAQIKAYKGGDWFVQLPRAATGVMTLPSGISENSITNITLNGVGLTPIVATSTITSDNLDQVANAIAGQPNITSVTRDYSNNTLTIFATAGNTVDISVATTQIGGATGPIDYWIVSSSVVGTFWGVAVWNVNSTNTYTPQGYPAAISGSVVPYLPGQPVQVMQWGKINVAPEPTNSSLVASPVTNGSPVYVRTTATSVNPIIGAFRTDDDGGTAILVPAYAAQWVYGNASQQGGTTAVLNVSCMQGG